MSPTAPPPMLKRPARWVPAGVVFACLTLLAVLYFVDPAHSRLYPKCVLYQATGLQCPGCGGLRATHALLHGDVVTAFRLNPLLVLLSPLLGYLLLREIMRSAWGKNWPTPFRRPWTVWVLLAGLVAYMVWRNIPWFLRLTGGG